MCRAALQDRLVNLCFQGAGVVGVRMQRREQRSGMRQVALGLCNTRLFREGIHVVRYDIENPIELSQGFGETTKTDIGIRVLGEQVNVARRLSHLCIDAVNGSDPLPLPRFEKTVASLAPKNN